ncbi:hypothetical protein [Ruegeria arenilitoris]|uniref:hypothetical protein n=1 Tax=Ruegeria arenilitoris TaxID=1173585 RepID=UPI00147E0452|nr:hypothetical protein [Ruegeria arenilitoris]
MKKATIESSHSPCGKDKQRRMQKANRAIFNGAAANVKMLPDIQQALACLNLSV